MGHTILDTCGIWKQDTFAVVGGDEYPVVDINSNKKRSSRIASHTRKK